MSDTAGGSYRANTLEAPHHSDPLRSSTYWRHIPKILAQLPTGGQVCQDMELLRPERGLGRWSLRKVTPAKSSLICLYHMLSSIMGTSL